MEYKAINDKVIVEVIDESKGQEFLRIESKKNTLAKGVVVSIGEKVKNVIVGDNVLFSIYGFEPFEENEKQYGILDNDMIYGKF